MKVTFIGDPRGREGSKADNPASVTLHGITFPLDKTVTVKIAWARAYGAKVKSNSHFKVSK